MRQLFSTAPNQRSTSRKFSAEKRNRHARVLAVRQALGLKEMAGIFVNRVKKEGYEVCMLFQ